MSDSHHPILVTGIHRGGTSWVGKMLAADAATAYINEPLNVLHQRGVLRAPVRYRYTHITAENESQFLPAYKELLDFQYHFWAEIFSIRTPADFLRMTRDFRTFFIGSTQRQRALLKDPFAVFSAPWFAHRLHCQVVITVRHPAAFASSLKRLNWRFDSRNLLDQPTLMRDHLEADRADLESVSIDDIIAQAALLWRLIYRFVHSIRGQYPDFKVVRHEDLSLNPVGHYKSLYESLGLRFTEKVQRTILNCSSADNPTELLKKKPYAVKLDSSANLKNWKKRLTEHEITRIRRIAEPVANLFYTENEW